MIKRMEINREKILKIIRNSKGLAEKDIRAMTGIAPGDLKEIVSTLEARGEVVRNRRGKLTVPEKKEYVKGHIEVKRAGFGFVSDEDGDIFIRKDDMKNALNGEEVLVKIIKDSGRENREGAVVRITSDPAYAVTGIVHHDDEGYYVLPDDRTVGKIFLSKGDKNAVDENVVICLITKRGDFGLAGKITEVLGRRGDSGIDILAVAKRFGMEKDYPEECREEIEKVPESVSERELKGRKLLFEKKIITIDGETAKDLDDAVSIERLENGNRLLGVHIADVSHYVREGTLIDKEALKRGTSVYLLDRVIPMLPPELSNGICSLNEGVTRLTLSCFMEFDDDARVVSSRVERTAIRSLHRMTYTAVNAILDGDPDLIKEYADIVHELRDMDDLARGIRKIREDRGGIDFEETEPEITLDEKGVPTSIEIRERGEGERLIEDFMIKANECVAEMFRDLPFLYRIHERPSWEKTEILGKFLANFGINIKDQLQPSDVREVLERVKGTKIDNIVSEMVLRSMQKARYSTENAGHFGLASRAYSHFTSPIRRYPDLQIHRIINEKLLGHMDKAREAELRALLPGVADSTSKSEVKAVEAERKADDIKKAQYMSSRIGERFEGIVSGIGGSAIFVRLPNTVEGYISLSEIKDDYYEVMEELQCIIGVRSGRRISLGDAIRVVVLDADVEQGRVEFGAITKDRTSSDRTGRNGKMKRQYGPGYMKAMRKARKGEVRGRGRR